MSTCSNSYECAANSVCTSLELSGSSSKQCTCVPGYYFDEFIENKCLPQLTHGNSCISENECNQHLGLDCFFGLNKHGKCSCRIDYFWNGFECQLSYVYGEECNATLVDSCRVSRILNCDSATSKCACNPDSIWNSYNNLCMVTKSTINEYCGSIDDCLENVSLTCQMNKCKCAEGDKWFWSVYAKKCIKCPLDWTVYNDHCYLVESVTTTWFEAYEACKTLNGSHLMIINDQEEFEMLTKFYFDTFGNKTGSLWVRNNLFF